MAFRSRNAWELVLQACVDLSLYSHELFKIKFCLPTVLLKLVLKHFRAASQIPLKCGVYILRCKLPLNTLGCAKLSDFTVGFVMP